MGVALRLLSVSVEIRKHVKSTSEPKEEKKNPLKNNTRAVTGPLISQFTVYSQAVAEIV